MLVESLTNLSPIKIKKELEPMPLQYGRHFIDEDDIAAVVAALKSPSLTQGPLVQKFEQAIADSVGSTYAVSVSSWTAGLHLSCLASRVRPGDTVLTSPMSFVASANCAFYVGAKPAFADIDPTTLNMRPDLVEKECKRLGNVKAIIPVHFGGLPCDMEGIQKVAKKYNAVVIEDAAHALGAKFEDGTSVGSCKYSDITGFSFHPVKNIACGEGGVITTNDKNIYMELLRLRSHGINKANDGLVVTEEAFTDGKQNQWYYEMQELGYNFRLTEIQCALGISQLKKLSFFLKRRVEIADHYDKEFSKLKNMTPVHFQKRTRSGNHLYLGRVRYQSIGCTRYELMERLKTYGVSGHVHYIPIPMQPYYKENLDIPFENYKEALAYYREALTLPLFPTMTDMEVETVVKAVKTVIG